LHNLLCQDRNFGYVPTFQTIAPGFYLSGRKVIQPVLSRIAQRVHPTRIIDNVPLAMDAPQEEEFAVANLSTHSFLHQYTFPKRAPYYFKNYVLFDGMSNHTLTEWKRVYLDVLRKASFNAKGKRLVLKSPANSGRIASILNLFPGAKFIHLYRNPYRVFLSTLWVYKTVLPKSQVQQIAWEVVEEYVLSFYTQLMRKLLQDKEQIPLGNYVEIRFEDLETAPLAQLQKIYENLNLPAFAEVEPAFRTYLASIAGYRKNEYLLTDEVVDKVNRHWQFALDRWAYRRLDRGEIVNETAYS
jgi:hypothetical protein